MSPRRLPCPVPSCDRDKPINYLLCKRCWSRGTRALKHGVMEASRIAADRTADRPQRVMASSDYLRLCRELIMLVDGKLKADTQKQEAEGAS